MRGRSADQTAKTKGVDDEEHEAKRVSGHIEGLHGELRDLRSGIIGIGQRLDETEKSLRGEIADTFADLRWDRRTTSPPAPDNSQLHSIEIRMAAIEATVAATGRLAIAVARTLIGVLYDTDADGKQEIAAELDANIETLEPLLLSEGR